MYSFVEYPHITCLFSNDKSKSLTYLVTVHDLKVENCISNLLEAVKSCNFAFASFHAIYIQFDNKQYTDNTIIISLFEDKLPRLVSFSSAPLVVFSCRPYTNRINIEEGNGPSFAGSTQRHS